MTEWTQRSGYVRIREELHRAEEALILASPIERVVAGAIQDELRLEGSSIEHRDALLTYARNAVATLAQKEQLHVTTQKPGVAPAGPITPADERVAREVLQSVRRAINDFRDEQRWGLVRARNRLWWTLSLTAFATLGLLDFAILAGAPVFNLTAALAVFLIGAAMGLFNRLYLDANVDTATEDYGLSTVRLFHTPVISGIAALGGVMIMPMLSVLVTSSAGGKSAELIPSLGEIFDLSKRPFGVVVAALFGMSPAVLISRLQQEAEKYKADLKSSNSTTT